jgi:2-polyprenyl-3-methyl-5-hydroxy-6-metoxy-1,4-benzoquinol methylase
LTDKTRLSTQAYWEEWYVEGGAAEARPARGRARRMLESLFGTAVVDSIRTNYADALAWHVIYPAHLPRKAGLKFLEVGSAPGTNLVRMKSSFGYEPYGIEYTKSGAKQNREMFASHGIDPNNVIEADFFSDDVATRFKGAFDVVFSSGFIEHFTDMDRVIDRHIDLVADGGILMIDIPNLKGLNYALTKAVNPSILGVHNLSIMDAHAFRGLFQNRPLRPLYCDYYGTINLRLFFSDNKYLRSVVERTFGTAQLVLNLLLNQILLKRGKRLESKYTSPYLLYIGQKQG